MARPRPTKITPARPLTRRRLAALAAPLALAPMAIASPPADTHAGGAVPVWKPSLLRLGPDYSSGIEERWRLQTLGNLWGSPALVGDTVFVFNTTGKGYIHAVNVEDGTERWVFADASWNHMTNYQVSVDGPVLAMGWNWDGILYALDAADGSQLWQAALDTSPDELTYLDMIDGTVYICNRGEFLALDGENGGERWRAALDFWWNYRPAIAEGLVAYGTSEGSLHALAVEDGSQRWQAATNDQLFAPVIVDGVLVIGSESGTIYGFDAQSGEERWRAATDAEVTTRVLVNDTTVYVGNASNNLHAFSLQDGGLLWRSFSGEETPTVVVASHGVVVVRGDDRNLAAFDATSGVERWRLSNDSEVTSGLRIDEDGILYIGSHDGNVHAIDTATGDELWRFETEHSVFSTPAVTDDLVLVTGWDTLVALGGRPARFEPGAKARVTSITPLQAAPNSTAVQRAQLEPGTIVTLTGASESRDGVVWWPVSVDDTGATGWVDEADLQLQAST
jgi:outer membrane protein assembly factor BamB